METASPAAIDTGLSTSMDSMPTVYKTDMPPTATSTQPHTDQTSDVVDVEFVKGVHGILKVVEMIFSLVTFICATVDGSFVREHGGGWVQFVSMTSFLCTAILYVFHAFKLPPKFPDRVPFKFAEFTYYVVVDVFYFISGVVSSVFAYSGSAVVAAAIFSFFSMAVYCCNTYFRFMDWRHSGEGPYFSSLSASLGTSSGGSSGTQY